MSIHHAGARRSARLSRLLLQMAFLVYAAILVAAGCAGGGADDPAEIVRRDFAVQAAEVLLGGEGFVRSARGGYAPASTEDLGAALGKRGGLTVALPERGEDAVRFHLLGGLEIGVREIGASGEGRLSQRSIAYPREGGTSFWRTTDAGYEEWLLLDEGVAERGRPAASWEIEGAALREKEGAVEIADASGAAQIRVTAPVAFAVGGESVPVKLTVNGARIELWVDADLRRVLVDPIWTVVAPMTTPRGSHTATKLTNGKVLVAGGYTTGASVLGTAEIYEPASGNWSGAGTLVTARAEHTATLLGDGRVMIVGGASATGVIATAEVYTPGTNAWTAVASMNDTRMAHTAVSLVNGNLLVAGGYGSSVVRASAEVYNPTTNVWTSAGTMTNGARHEHAAVRLSNGNVLVAGGRNGAGTYLATADVYNPTSNAWSGTSSMNSARSLHTMTLLANSGVLVTGGYTTGNVETAGAEIYTLGAGWAVSAAMSTARSEHRAVALVGGKVLVVGGSYLATAEVYDYNTNAWTPAGSMSTGRTAHGATLLADGRVLVSGGYDGVNYLSTVERYDATATTWTNAASMQYGRRCHVATRLNDGRVLVVGGLDASGNVLKSELYNPTNNTWSYTANFPTSARKCHTATKLNSGNVIIAGGYLGLWGSSQLYDAATQTWTLLGSMVTPREDGQAVLLANGKVLVSGGFDGTSIIANAELYDEATNSWSPTGNMSSARKRHTLTLLGNSKVLATGGDNSGSLATAELFEPSTGAWTLTGSLTTARQDHTAVRLTDGKVLVAGGASYSLFPTYYASAELFDPNAGTWSSAGSMSGSRAGHIMVRLDDGRVLVAGGRSGTFSTTYLQTANLYNPSSNSWSVATPMNAARSSAASAVLSNGKVFVTGGNNAGGTLATTEYYTP